MKFGTETYRAGALERIGEAELLMGGKQYAGSMYLAGLAVEGMLRSLKWLRDRGFDERHDLQLLASQIESLGLLRPGNRDDDFVATVQEVVATWSNDLRFAGVAQLERWLHMSHTRTRRSRNLLKICKEHYEQCSTVVKRCEVLWQRQRSQSSKTS